MQMKPNPKPRSQNGHHSKRESRKEDSNTAIQILYIVSEADHSFVLRVASDAFAKARTIENCMDIYLQKNDNGGPPPWWYQIALELVEDLYTCLDLALCEERIIKFILGLGMMSKSASCHYYVSKNDKMKVADAMVFIHKHHIVGECQNYEEVSESIYRIINITRRKLNEF